NLRRRAKLDVSPRMMRSSAGMHPRLSTRNKIRGLTPPARRNELTRSRESALPLLRHHRLHAAAHLLFAHVFDVGADCPDVAEGVDHLTRAVAVELILDRPLHGGS